jgi:hypothetical protein
MLERIIEICPDDLWNTKKSGFIFWQQVIHVLSWMNACMRDGKMKPLPFSDFNGKNIYPDFENIPEIMLTKSEIIECCKATKEIAKKCFSGKDDNWLKLPWEKHNKVTNFDMLESSIKHLIYHIGHCEAVFRENGIKTGEYLDYY